MIVCCCLKTLNGMQRIKDERSRSLQRQQALEDTLRSLQNAYVQEADGTGGSGQRGIDKLTKLKKDAYDNYLLQTAPELSALKQTISHHDSLLADANNALKGKQTGYENTLQNNMGFLERNKALSDLSREESSVFWSTLLISLLIILIETGPVLSKLIMPVGPYDVALAKEELLQMASAEQDLRKGKHLIFEKKKLFYQKQKMMSDELVEKLTAMQQKNIDEELKKWEAGMWQEKDHKPSMDEVMRKIKQQYQLDEENIL